MTYPDSVDVKNVSPHHRRSVSTVEMKILVGKSETSGNERLIINTVIIPVSVIFPCRLSLACVYLPMSSVKIVFGSGIQKLGFHIYHRKGFRRF